MIKPIRAVNGSQLQQIVTRDTEASWICFHEQTFPSEMYLNGSKSFDVKSAKDDSS
jgi:hypothetical protein